jgi:hypothetical protein
MGQSRWRSSHARFCGFWTAVSNACPITPADWLYSLLSYHISSINDYSYLLLLLFVDKTRCSLRFRETRQQNGDDFCSILHRNRAFPNFLFQKNSVFLDDSPTWTQATIGAFPTVGCNLMLTMRSCCVMQCCEGRRQGHLARCIPA